METDYMVEVVKVVFYSGLVLLLIYLLGLYVRRLPLLQPKGKRIEVLERIPLGPKQGLYLIRIDEQLVLLGVSEGGMELLKELGERDDGDEGELE